MFDTAICIYIIKRRPPATLRKFLASEPGDVCISAVTLAELTFGVENSVNRAQNASALEAFLLPMVIAPFDFSAAREYGDVRTSLERAGTPIGALDTMIAAQARSLNLEFVTNNLREFSGSDPAAQ